MSSAYIDHAVRVSPPDAVYARTTVTSSESFMLPASFNKQWITIAADTVDVSIRLRVATAAITADATARSTVATNEIAAATNGTVTIPAGTQKDFDLSQLQGASLGAARIWIAHISASTSGVVRFWKSSGPR